MCGTEVRMEPSWPSGDATCPRCGTLLWPERRHPRAVGRPYRWLLKAIFVVGLLVCVSLPVLLGLMLLPGWRPFGLGLPEIVVLVILGILLFGRKLPEIARYLNGVIGNRYP
jgi:hypothetical protein